jgi:hypothetical protein
MKTPKMLTLQSMVLLIHDTLGSEPIVTTTKWPRRALHEVRFGFDKQEARRGLLTSGAAC